MGYHRLHILCGESQRSETAIWLKVGTTAVIVAMIEAGLKPGDDMNLASPVNALRAVAADTHCKEKLELVGGQTASALDIQRRYLSLAELHQNDSFMPPWTRDVCLRWRQILDLLEESPAKTHKMLDWTIKQALYAHHFENRGVQWEKIYAWNKVVGVLQAALNQSRRYCLLRPDFVLGPNSPVLEAVAQLAPFIRENGMRWDGLEGFLQLKQEMFEIDTRFGQLGERSVFQSLDRTGMLEHHVDGADNIEQAASHPPQTGRARIRGEMVRRLADQGSKYKCTWQAIWDHEKRPVFDLSDPFAEREYTVSANEPGAHNERSECNEGSEHNERSVRDDRQSELPFANDIDPLLRQFLGMRGRSRREV
jgi:hypothetical protein